jgi:hypothetical protein
VPDVPAPRPTVPGPTAGRPHGELADAAAKAADGTASRANELAALIAPAAARAVAAAFPAWADEAADARRAIDGPLVAAMEVLAKAARPDQPDRERVERAAADVNRAAAAALSPYAWRQADGAERDPLTAARWYARAAAASLTRVPPDVTSAGQAQRRAADALDRVRVAALRRASVDRLSAVRQLRPTAHAAADTGNAGRGGPAPSSPWAVLVREWRRLRPRGMDDAADSLRGTELPGYEAATQAYFEALGGREGGKRYPES